MNRIISFFFILFIVALAFVPEPCHAKDSKKFVVVLDAGHGGGDIGTPHRKMKKDEKTIALDLTLRIGKYIESHHSDVKVVYTRKKDIYPSLPERTKIAKDAQGDLFVSIHVNAAPNSAARGIETYVFGVTGLKGKSADEQKRIKDRMANERENLDISGKQVDFDKDMDIETKILCQAQREKNNIHSEEVANFVHKAMISAIKKTSYKSNVNDRGVKEKNIFVLCYSPMPAILVELGYLSNPAEEKFLNSEEAMTAFCNAIVSGIEKYKASWDKRKLGNSSTQEKDSKEQKSDSVDTQEPVETKPSTQKQASPKASEPKAPVQKEKANSASNDIFYKIQFLTSDKILNKGNSLLKGLWPVSYYKEGNLFKYTCGESTTSAGLSAELKKIKNLFPDAFIIKTDAEGKRIK